MAQTTIYISSTYADLVAYRHEVTMALRRMRKNVMVMEEYVAGDERPLERCLEDVEQCDIYVGLFAWRYGFIPPQQNPDQRSITELELRRAIERKKPCLIFLLAEDAIWPRKWMDDVTGDGERGERVKKLREELQAEWHASFFSSPDNLATLVSNAVSLLEEKRKPSPPKPSLPAKEPRPEPREITHQLLLAYADQDQDLALELEQSQQRGMILAPRLLFANDENDFVRLEKEAQRSATAAVILSATTLDRFDEARRESRRVLDLLRARTGCLVALCRDAACAARAQSWPCTAVHDLSQLSPDRRAQLIADLIATDGVRRVGLPLLIVAMTRAEAEELVAHPELIEQSAGLETRQRFDKLREALTQHGRKTFVEHYQRTREAWAPFQPADSAPRQADPQRAMATLGSLLADVVERIHRAAGPGLRGRQIKLQGYPLDPLLEDATPLRPIYNHVAHTGCLVVIDELSLFHPRLREAVLASPLIHSRQVAMVTVSPLDPRRRSPTEILEQEIERRLGSTVDRFSFELDPQCELGIGDASRLKRWLFSSLPEAVARLREPSPSQPRIASFATELGVEPDRRFAAGLYSAGGSL